MVYTYNTNIIFLFTTVVHGVRIVFLYRKYVRARHVVYL